MICGPLKLATFDRAAARAGVAVIRCPETKPTLNTHHATLRFEPQTVFDGHWRYRAGRFWRGTGPKRRPHRAGAVCRIFRPCRAIGYPVQPGAKAVFDQLNAAGGVGKRMVEIRTLDDGYEPDRCAENTRKLIADDVFALFGYVGTPTSLAAVPCSTRPRCRFRPVHGAESLRQPFNRLMFHVRASYYDETALIVRQLVNLGVKKIAVFHQNDAYGKAGLDGVNKALAEHKLPLAGAATVERNSVDVAAAVEKLVAAKPDAVVQIAAYGASAAFVRAARKAGLAARSTTCRFVGTQALADELGRMAPVWWCRRWCRRPTSPRARSPASFWTPSKGGDKVQPNYSSMEGFLAARIFTEGLRQAAASGKISPRQFHLWHGRPGLPGDFGLPVSFGPNDHTASSFVEMSMLTGDGRVRT